LQDGWLILSEYWPVAHAWQRRSLEMVGAAATNVPATTANE
jgi:hypothetical protein